MAIPAHLQAVTGDSVDLLVVMDTSNSMREAQALAANQLGILVNTLLERMQLRDVRVGVVTTDLGTGTYVIPSCGVRGGDAARLNPRVNGPSIATPWVLSTIEEMKAFYPGGKALTVSIHRRNPE